MKLRSELTVNGRVYHAGDEISPWMIYPFFLLHMLAFGFSGFWIAYGNDNPEPFFAFLHGGIAITVYIVFYLAIFGRDEVKWMFINAALGLMGIYAQIKYLLALFGRRLSDYPLWADVMPFLYYILYTFLLRHALLDLTGARDNPQRRRIVESGYVAISLLAYAILLFVGRGQVIK